jgi:hypothetical protein
VYETVLNFVPVTSILAIGLIGKNSLLLLCLIKEHLLLIAWEKTYSIKIPAIALTVCVKESDRHKSSISFTI